MSTYLFVYGTLRPGQAAWPRLAPHARGAEPAWCHGRLVAFPEGYPGVVLGGDRRVHGELVELIDPEAAWPALDVYEGDAYARVERAVETVRGPVTAWIYELRSPALAARGAPVPGGAWSGSDPAGRTSRPGDD